MNLSNKRHTTPAQVDDDHDATLGEHLTAVPDDQPTQPVLPVQAAPAPAAAPGRTSVTQTRWFGHARTVVGIACLVYFAVHLFVSHGSAQPVAASSGPATVAASPVAAAPTTESSESSSVGNTDPSDVAYLAVLDQNNINYGSDKTTAVTAAHNICSFLASGHTQTEAGLIAVQSGYSAADAGTIVGAATGAYCPQSGGTWTN